MDISHLCYILSSHDNSMDAYVYQDKLNTLTPREKEIITRRYGLNNREEETQKEIAKELGISRSYVSRIEKRALTKMLRDFIKDRQYDEY